MLSICIPIYAYDVRPFVRQLHAQAASLSIAWEILLLDDASPSPWPETNRELGQLAGVRYECLSKNIGRAAIRNELAQRAQYAYLLFLDGDGALETPDFLATYVQHLPSSHVLCGGRTYAIKPPHDQHLRLHWHYGRRREVRTAANRQVKPYLGFMTNNFVVPKDVLLRLPFDERISGYGHEDTVFGLALQKAGIPISHLDNPVRHIGLEPADIWLRKQGGAINNLRQIASLYPAMDTRLLSTSRKLRRWGIKDSSLRILLKPISGILRRHLLRSRSPRLWVFDTLKLYWLSQ